MQVAEGRLSYSRPILLCDGSASGVCMFAQHLSMDGGFVFVDKNRGRGAVGFV